MNETSDNEDQQYLVLFSCWRVVKEKVDSKTYQSGRVMKRTKEPKLTLSLSLMLTNTFLSKKVSYIHLLFYNPSFTLCKTEHKNFIGIDKTQV
jgi:hypothetical protein